MRRANSGIDRAALKAEIKAMDAQKHAKQLKKQLDDREELELSRKSEERNTAAFATGAFTAAGMGHFFSHVGGFVSSLSSIALGGDLGKTVGVENQSISTAIASNS